jgi:hypothetical protein
MSEATFSTTPTGDRIRDRFTVLVNSSMYQRGFDVLLCIALAAPITMEAKAADELQCMVIPPTLSGLAGQEFLQSALEAAWAAGLCPKNHRSAPMPNQPAEHPAASRASSACDAILTA